MSAEKMKFTISTGNLPDLDELLDDAEMSKEWALAKIDADIKKEAATGEKAHLGDRVGDFLDSMYALGEKEAVREEVERGEGEVWGFAQAQWFEEARRQFALDKIIIYVDDPSSLRRTLARRALGAIDLAF